MMQSAYYCHDRTEHIKSIHEFQLNFKSRKSNCITIEILFIQVDPNQIKEEKQERLEEKEVIKQERKFVLRQI